MKSINEFLVKKHISKPSIEDVTTEIMNYIHSDWWECSDDGKYWNMKFTVGEDEEGYYIDTENGPKESMICGRRGSLDIKSFNYIFTTQIDRYNKNLKGNCPYFRWRSHKGLIVIPENLLKLESLDGLPLEIDKLFISEMCGCQVGTIDLGDRKIDKIRLHNIGKIKLTGNAQVNEISWLGWNGKEPQITFSCKNMHKE